MRVLGQRLSDLRGTRSLKAMARKLGIDPTTYAKIERAQGGCTVPVLDQIAARLGIPAHELITPPAPEGEAP